MLDVAAGAGDEKVQGGPQQPDVTQRAHGGGRRDWNTVSTHSQATRGVMCRAEQPGPADYLLLLQSAPLSALLISCLSSPGPLLNPLIVFCPTESELKQWLYHLEKQIQLNGGSLGLPFLAQVSLWRCCAAVSHAVGSGLNQAGWVGWMLRCSYILQWEG